VLLCEEHIKSSEKEPGLKLFNIDVIRQQIPLTKRNRLSSKLPSWPRLQWEVKPVIRNAAQQGNECLCLQFGTFFIYCFLHVAKANAMKANLPMKKWRQCQPWRPRRRWAVMIKNLGIANDLMLLLTLLTSLLTMPLLLLLPRKKNLCRSLQISPTCHRFENGQNPRFGHVSVGTKAEPSFSLAVAQRCFVQNFSCSQTNRSNILPLVLILSILQAV
jgi:hypothetical protein